jgi:hypothetical protein
LAFQYPVEIPASTTYFQSGAQRGAQHRGLEELDAMEF